MEFLEAWVKGTLQWLHIIFVRASCLLVLQCLHRLLVVRTGKCFPISRSRTSSGTPLTPGLFLVRKCDLHVLFISRPTVSCLTRASRNESWSRWQPLLQFHIIKLFTIARSMRKLADGATIWVSPYQLHIILVSGRSDLLLPLLSCILQLRRGKE
jgi:hypothetical protein